MLWQPHSGSAPHLRQARGADKPTWRQRYFEAMEEEALQSCERILALSPKVSREFRQRREGVAMTLLPPPLLSDREPEERSGLVQPEWALFCGRDARLKGAATAVRWFRALRRRWPKLGLRAWSRSVSHLERVLGQDRQSLAKEKIFLHGWDGGFEAALPEAQILLHPTAYDACSLVCLEAAAAGLSVLTTPGNGFAELVTEPWVGVLPAEAEAEAAQTSLGRLWSKRLEMGPDAWQHGVWQLRKRFDLETHVAELARVLQNAACR